MKILFAASEASPFIKTGGLADVIGALPPAIAKQSNVDEVCVFLPYYSEIKYSSKFKDIEYVTNFHLFLAWKHIYCGLYKYHDSEKNVTYYFIDNEDYFNVETIYGCFNDGERFAFFSKAILESLLHIDFEPDVIHANDWQTALIPAYIKINYTEVPKIARIKVLFTIHNIEYQGIAGSSFTNDVLCFDASHYSNFEHDNCVNFMKSAIILADKVSTVSKTYSYEIRHAYYAHGLENVLQHHSDKLVGIVNGIDTELFNASTDPLIYENFDSNSLDKKAINKRLLQKEFGLPERDDVPLFAMVSRLVAHKGLDLVDFVSHELMNQDIQIVVIGTGDSKYQEMFYRLQYYYPEKVSVKIMFDVKLSHKIYAGADFLLMPSQSEPCGLSQLISMRYGTIPIVRETGGLYDTVPPINADTLEGRGFTFKLYNAHDMLGAIKRAEYFFYDKNKLGMVKAKIMNYDSSWNEPIRHYLEEYNGMINNN